MGNKKKHHQDKRERAEEEEEETVAVEKVEEGGEEEEEKKSQLVEPKKVQYCPVCSLPFELCKYGKDAVDCAIFLYKLAPTKVNKYHPDFKPDQVDLNKPTKAAEETKAKQKEDAKSKTIKDKYIVIDVKNRGKKHYTTTVSGLENFGVDCKDLAKKCSKKFAVSCSAIDQGTVQLQGDNFEGMKDVLLAEYKQIKKKYIIDKEDFNTKVAEEKQKLKEARKAEKNVIQEEPEEEEEKKQPEVKDVNQLRQELIQATMQEGSDDD